MNSHALGHILALFLPGLKNAWLDFMSITASWVSVYFTGGGV